jgi:hypothetical protein
MIEQSLTEASRDGHEEYPAISAESTNQTYCHQLEPMPATPRTIDRAVAWGYITLSS